MAGKKGQKKRVLLDDEKVSICTQARVVYRSTAQDFGPTIWMIALALCRP